MNSKLLRLASQVREAEPKMKKLFAGKAHRYLDKKLSEGKINKEEHSATIFEFLKLAYE